MLTINDKKIESGYSLSIDYVIHEQRQEETVEVRGFLVPFARVKLRKPTSKRVTVTPILIIQTQSGTCLDDLLSRKCDMCQKAMDFPGAIFKRDYCFDCSFDDLLCKYDTGKANLYSCIPLYKKAKGNIVTYGVRPDWYEGYYDFMQYIGEFDVPVNCNNDDDILAYIRSQHR